MADKIPLNTTTPLPITPKKIILNTPKALQRFLNNIINDYRQGHINDKTAKTLTYVAEKIIGLVQNQEATILANRITALEAIIRKNLQVLDEDEVQTKVN